MLREGGGKSEEEREVYIGREGGRRGRGWEGRNVERSGSQGEGGRGREGERGGGRGGGNAIAVHITNGTHSIRWIEAKVVEHEQY